MQSIACNEAKLGVDMCATIAKINANFKTLNDHIANIGNGIRRLHRENVELKAERERLLQTQYSGENNTALYEKISKLEQQIATNEDTIKKLKASAEAYAELEKSIPGINANLDALRNNAQSVYNLIPSLPLQPLRHDPVQFYEWLKSYDTLTDALKMDVNDTRDVDLATTYDRDVKTFRDFDRKLGDESTRRSLIDLLTSFLAQENERKAQEALQRAKLAQDKQQQQEDLLKDLNKIQERVQQSMEGTTPASSPRSFPVELDEQRMEETTHNPRERPTQIHEIRKSPREVGIATVNRVEPARKKRAAREKPNRPTLVEFVDFLTNFEKYTPEKQQQFYQLMSADLKKIIPTLSNDMSQLYANGELKAADKRKNLMMYLTNPFVKEQLKKKGVPDHVLAEIPDHY